MISVGNLALAVSNAIEMIATKAHHNLIGHYNLQFVKPLDHNGLTAIMNRYEHIIIYEDGVIHGGASSAILEWVSAHNYTKKITRKGIDDVFVEHGSTTELQKIVQIDQEAIYCEITKHI